MHVLRDSASIRGAVTKLPAISAFIARRLEELAEYDDYELDQLVNIVVVEPCDSLAEVNVAVGLETETRAADAIEVHSAWFELTYVLGDEGFGVVLYVPNDLSIDPRLLQVCLQQTVGKGQP